MMQKVHHSSQPVWALTATRVRSRSVGAGRTSRGSRRTLGTAVTTATQAAFGAYVAAPGAREARFYYWGVPVSDMARWRELGRASGYALPGADDPYGGHGTPDDQFTCVVDTSAVAEQAYRALCQHRTQAGDPWYQLLAQQDNWRAVFARSRFVRIHPAPRPGDPVESSLVEGFDHD